jgi:type VI secretion system secreted protein VgrG
MDMGSKASFLFEIKGNSSAVTVVNFNIWERMSSPYMLNLSLACPKPIKFDGALQKEALLTIKGQGTDRYVHGIVSRFEHTGQTGSKPQDIKYLYDAQVIPFTQLLSLEQDCRIFQDKQVQEIVEDIFKDSKIPSDRYEFRLFNKEHKRRFCVQYRETDLDFINRILQEEGIYYFYEHSKDKHIMVFADDPVCHKPISGNTSLEFKPASGLNPESEVISLIQFSRRLRPGTYVQTNYNFKKPSLPLKTLETHKDENIQKYEIYDYPGQYGDQDKGKRLTKIGMEEKTALAEQAKGESNCLRLIPGYTFKVEGNELVEFNKEYLLIELTTVGGQPQTLEEHAGGTATKFGNDFVAIPSSVCYRPKKTIDKPVIHGLQSATVVGPENEEIYVDEYGRVKVQFHWDRIGKKNEQSSCWLRCAQAWGGGGWGSMFIPRIGDEVLVSFMEGDPDWPIITGSVYNGSNMPLYGLPAGKTCSVIRTRSTPQGSYDNYNELRFEDKSGNEEIYLQGEKDWNILIKNDKGQTIGHDETLSVANNRTKSVGVNQSESIGMNKTITVGANHSESIGSNMTLTVGANKFDTTAINVAETVGAAKELTIGGLYQISVGGAMNETVAGAKAEEVGGYKALVVANNMTEYVKADRKSTVDGNLDEKVEKKHSSQAKEFIIEAKEKITIKVGSSTIVMDANSITIEASKIFQN